jgi:hypothetical protein
METRKVYLLEDECCMSIIFDTKESWLESLRYNLDEALEEEDEEYLENATKKANKLYEDMESGKKEYSDWVNGWWYSYNEIDVFYEDRNVMLVSHYHQTSYRGVVTAYWRDEDTYFAELDASDYIIEDSNDEDILTTLKDIIGRDDVDYQAIIKELREYWGLE